MGVRVSGSLPLDGVRVADYAQAFVGLDCTMLLADRGRNSQHTAQILEDLALDSQRPTDEEPRSTSDQDDVADVAAAEREML